MIIIIILNLLGMWATLISAGMMEMSQTSMNETLIIIYWIASKNCLNFTGHFMMTGNLNSNCLILYLFIDSNHLINTIISILLNTQSLLFFYSNRLFRMYSNLILFLTFLLILDY